MEISLKLDSEQLARLEALLQGTVSRALKSHIKQYHKKKGG